MSKDSMPSEAAMRVAEKIVPDYATSGPNSPASRRIRSIAWAIDEEFAPAIEALRRIYKGWDWDEHTNFPWIAEAALKQLGIPLEENE